jgi:hypothetical protein
MAKMDVMEILEHLVCQEKRETKETRVCRATVEKMVVKVNLVRMASTVDLEIRGQLVTLGLLEVLVLRGKQETREWKASILSSIVLIG